MCGSPMVVVQVHGHGQCSQCGSNVEPCCAGAGPDDASATADMPEFDADPELFERLFVRLGGEGVTVTGEALRFSLAQWLGTGLEEAGVVIEAGVHVGKLAVAAPGTYRLA